MKILIYRWNAYNYRDTIENFRALGHEVSVLEYHLDNYDEDETFAELLTKEIRGNTYDFVFTINYYAVIAEVCHTVGIRYVAWTCDNPLISMHHESVFYDTNRIFSFDKTNEIEFRQMGVSNISYLPLCVDAARMQRMILESPKMGLYPAEISFVGSLYERNAYDSYEHAFSDYERGYFDAAIEVSRGLYGMPVPLVERLLTPEVMERLEENNRFELKKSARSLSSLALIFRTTILGFKIAKEQRIYALNMLSKKHAVAVYSNSDITQVPLCEYRGSLDYFSEMPLAFSESKVNLNFTIPNIKSGIPLRVWDVLGAGGFLLTNAQAELPLYFEDGKDLATFSSDEELCEKAAYYLSHESERERIAKCGYEKVAAHHTYRDRISTLLANLD